MADFDLKMNGAAIEAALREAFTDANLVFGRRAAREITRDKWQWPLGESPRDIVDKNGLRNSYAPTQVSPTEYDHAWTVDYAMAVHEGAVRTGSTMPGRPWTDAPVEAMPADFEKLAKSKLGRVK